MNETDNDKDFETEDHGFAAYLATRFMFLGVLPTKNPNRKSFVFLVPQYEDMDKHKLEYEIGAQSTIVPAVVMFNKLRLLRQHIRPPQDRKKVEL
jgi:hypothetical protein